MHLFAHKVSQRPPWWRHSHYGAFGSLMCLDINMRLEMFLLYIFCGRGQLFGVIGLASLLLLQRIGSGWCGWIASWFSDRANIKTPFPSTLSLNSSIWCLNSKWMSKLCPEGVVGIWFFKQITLIYFTLLFPHFLSKLSIIYSIAIRCSSIMNV